MNSHVNLRNRLSGVFRAAAALLLSCGVFLLNHPALADSTGILPGWLKHHHHHHPPALPEVNTGLVLIPVAFVIMLLSSLQLFRARAAQKR
jgi:hypothetical protein